MTMYSRLRANVPPQGTAGTAQATILGECAVDGVLSAAEFLPAAAVTFNASNFRTFTLFNRGPKTTGTGTTNMGTFDTSAVSLADNVAKAFTLSGTPANLAVAKGDVLEVVETIGGTGVAHGGGLAMAQITPS